MDRPAVEFREVTKRFGTGAPVLEGITFSVDHGEFVAFIGRSGCGKSTLLRMIAGLTPLSGGALRVDGAAAEAAVLRMGFVFQDPTLLPWLTVAQNIELPLRLRGLRTAIQLERREAALALVRLAERSTAYPRQLSGGQKMRVSLARALAPSPDILLLDEPFAALDEMTREHLNEELLAIRERQAWTAFFVTHSVHEAVFLASRVIVLSSSPGRILADIPITLPYPRRADTRLTREYQDFVADVSRRLRAVESTAP